MLDRETVFRDTLTTLLDTPPFVLFALGQAERLILRVCSDEWLVELLKNARDAAATTKGRVPRVRIAPTSAGLLVANDGSPFSLAGLQAITGLIPSAKRNQALLLGQPRPTGGCGIGFRSVLHLTQRPEIYSRDDDGNLIALAFGAPRLQDLCRAAARAEVDACLALLDESERSVFEKETSPPRDLPHRPLAQLLGHRDVDLERLLARLPVLHLPLWNTEPDPDALALIQGDPDAEEPPLDTVIHLPLDSDTRDRILAQAREDLQSAAGLFMGLRIQLQVHLDTHHG